MGKFISGVVFTVVSLALFGFGTILLLTALGATDVGEALAGIILIPVALFSYVAQVIFGAVAEGLLWSNFAMRGRARVASAVVASICAVAMLASISLFCYLIFTSDAATPA